MRVASGDDVVAALRRARPEEVVFLENGTVFPGNFEIENKPGLKLVGEGRAIFRGGKFSVIKFSHCNGLDIRSVIVEGSSKGSGIMVVHSANVNIAGCTSNRNAKSGILTGNCPHLNVEGNNCHENGEHGVYASQSGDFLNISSNHCYDNDRAGIQVNAREDDTRDPNDPLHDAISENVHILDNTLRGNQRKGGAAAINLACVHGGEVRRNHIQQHRGRHGIAMWDDELNKKFRKKEQKIYGCCDIEIDLNDFDFTPGKGKANIHVSGGCQRIKVLSTNKYARRVPEYVDEDAQKLAAGS